jgi:hypothetical protein
VTDTAIQVQNPAIGQVTVTFTSSTIFTRTERTTASSLSVGDCVVVMAGQGTEGAEQISNSDPISAQNITISKPTAGGCTGTGAFRGGAGGGTRPTGTPDPSSSPRPRRSPGAGGPGRPPVIIGTVTSTSGTTFTVQTIARGDTPATTRTVAPSGSTLYDQTVPASAAVVQVGACITAVGPADSTGAVTATSISVRQPGPNGCGGGFRRQNDAGGPARG